MAKIDFDYKNAADIMLKKGDYISALHYYFLESYKYERGKEENKEDLININVCISDTYVCMGLMKEAIRFLMRAHSLDQHNEEVLDRLSQCYKNIDDDAAFYYFALTVSDVNSLDNFDFEDDYQDEYVPLTVHDPRDKSKIFDQALDLMDDGKIDEGLRLLDCIDERSYQFADAALTRASIAMDQDDIRRALEISEEGLKADPKHLGIYAMKIAIYATLKDDEKVAEWIKKIDELDIKDEEEVAKVALCMCHFDQIDLAEKYINRKLEFTPYEKLMLLCLGSIYMIKGDKKAAFGVINKVCSIYPEDVETEELASRILSGRKMPDEAVELKKEWSNDIKKIFTAEDEDINSPENYRKVKWLLSGDNDLYLQSAVCAYITCMPGYDALMDELLIDPFVSLVIKKQIMLRRICDESTRKINVVVSNIFRSLKVKHPKTDDLLKFAYYYAFIALATVDYKFENRLEYRFKKIKAKFDVCSAEEKNKLTVDCLAALIFMNVSGMQSDKTIEIFNCDREELMFAEELLR